MDNDEIELLRKLLSNNDVKETLKKILLEDEPKKKVVKPKTVKTTTVKKPVKKTSVKKTHTKKPTIKSVEPKGFNTKKKNNYYEDKKNIFKDDLSQCIEEEVDGHIINLIEESKSIAKKFIKKNPRPPKKIPISVCQQCQTKFEGVGYLCKGCLGGRNA